MTINVVLNGVSFVESTPGKYVNSNNTYSDPADYLKISGGRVTGQNRALNASVTRHKEYADVDGDVKTMTLSLQVQLQGSIPVEELDNELEYMSNFLTITNLNKILSGVQ
jgi:hypothetical protein